MDAATAVGNAHRWFEDNSGWAPPDEGTLAEWTADGVCRCPDECLVTPEGWCEHGLASWALILTAQAREDASFKARAGTRSSADPRVEGGPVRRRVKGTMSADGDAVVLREERSAASSRYLGARVNSDGALVLTGHDLGEGIPFGDEYEYFTTIAADDLPQLVAVLGGAPGTDVLEVLASWTGSRSYDLERILRESDIHVSTYVV